MPLKNRNTNGKKNKKTAIPMESLPAPIYRHLFVLGLATVEAYLDWCRAHGFAARLRKSAIQLERELADAKRRRADACVRDARRARRPNQMLQRLLTGGDTEGMTEGMPPEMCSLHARMFGDEFPSRQREFTKRLLLRLSKRCPDLLWERSGAGAGTGVYLDVVMRMAQHFDAVVRDIDDWSPRTKNAGRRVASLARHLFARWDVPRFLDSAWTDNGEEGDMYRAWFLHLGAGNSIRTAQLPLLFTKKMAHHFTMAPDDYSVVEALRWGQVHGLGGDARLAEGLRGTRLCVAFDEDEFWVSVLRFLVANPMLDTVHIGPVADYLHNQRFVSEEVVGADGRVRVIPPQQPNLTMKGRTPDTLLAQVEAWHYRLGLGGASKSRVTWGTSGFRGFQSVEGTAKNQRIWTIRELCSTAQLQAEGRRMNHCVATYVGSCAAGHSSIWAMEVEDKDGLQKVLTIEVMNGAKTIVQAKGRSNALPKAQVRSVMARWAGAAGLAISSWV